MKRNHCLEVRGDFACFTRPEMKVERVSYDVITPSAARAVFEAILWKPVMRWRIRKIEVLNPIRWISLRRNEVSKVISARNVQTAMNNGAGNLGLIIEDDRQQRAGLFLRDVVYRLHAELEMLPHAGADNHPAKFHEMFIRRAEKGQCINQPYLGCREFSCDFRLVEAPENERVPVNDTRDLGWMLYDMDFTNLTNPRPQFFRAALQNGTLDLRDVEVRR